MEFEVKVYVEKDGRLWNLKKGFKVEAEDGVWNLK
jgi:hypothetical protein